MSFLTIDHLDKWYGDFHVLDDVSLAVERGEVICIIGPSGSGKSSLLRCVNNLEAIDGGRIHLDGELIGIEPYKDGFAKLKGKVAAAQKQRFGFVFQNFQLFSNMTVLENIMLAPVRVKGQARAQARERALELLEKVGLSDRADSYPGDISGGQQQRVAIARALAMDPEVLLFDEPTSALDPELVGEVLKTIRELAGQGYTMLVVTHQLEFAQKVADRVVFFDKGRIVEQGAPAEVLDNPQDPRTRKFLEAVQVEV
ncbi:amino acid ABC transporter ATP-binding protein [Brevibacterium sp. 91QC2O2]|uniref:amino acid ABC transporter ATP-binding protein n=1 Tax=Brevibacterium sp. 91QC2O2 TaxID=2968458 RepID=UPI00211BC9BF|nr:amino acid ABC transporter ATP-binding protein [Brevibacterium sp. 91QC2O2]MCQ9369386.1 amino acid ABC transporter ATP-binding protein [Brevibacterium sp. 91QC2O2]